MLQIRKATLRDLADIRNLYKELDGDAVRYQPSLFIQTERPDDFLSDLIQREKSDILLAVKDGQVIGFSAVQEKETPDISCLQKKRYVYIGDLVIAEAYRSSGYGAELLEASKAWGKQKGAEFLRLLAFAENRRGIEFYERNGLTATMTTLECEL